MRDLMATGLVLVLVLVGSAWAGGAAAPDLTREYRLQAHAEVLENHMPAPVDLSAQPKPCNALVVNFTITSGHGSLPDGFSATSVSLAKHGEVRWIAPASSRLEPSPEGAKMLTGVARDCRTDAFSARDVLDLVIGVKAGSTASDVKTSVRLFYAQ